MAEEEEAVCLVWEERDNDAELHQPEIRVMSTHRNVIKVKDTCGFLVYVIDVLQHKKLASAHKRAH